MKTAEMSECTHSTPLATLTVPAEDMYWAHLKLCQLDLPGSHPASPEVSTMLSDLMETELAKLHFH